MLLGESIHRGLSECAGDLKPEKYLSRCSCYDHSMQYAA